MQCIFTHLAVEAHMYLCTKHSMASMRLVALLSEVGVYIEDVNALFCYYNSKVVLLL